MSATALVRATFADSEEARRVASAVIEMRLAACVTLSAVESIFAWNGTIEQQDEVVAIFKTLSNLAPVLAAHIAGMHSYDLPAISWWPVACDARVAAWVEKAIGDPEVL